MIKNRYKIIILVIFILFGLYFNSNLISLNDFEPIEYYEDNNKHIINPKLAVALKYSDIHQNATTIYRLFESINFTIDTSNDFPDATNIKMEIQFSNNSIRNYDMTEVATDEFYYEYVPEYNAPLEIQNVSFYIYNASQTLLNNPITYTNFTIKSNCLANFYLDGLPSSEYYINDTIVAEILVINFTSDDNNTYNFQWDLTIVDNMDEATQINLLDLTANATYFTLILDNETFQQVNKMYFLKVNMSDITFGKKAAAYFPFTIRNSDPIITSNIDLSSDEVFRTDECTVSINTTDIETPPDKLNVKVYIYNSLGNKVIEEPLEHINESLFSDTIIIPGNGPIGKYKVTVITSDENGGTDSKDTFLTVKNNPPEIHSYTINGKSMDQAISINYGKDLIFSFNVSDIEDGVSFVKVALLNKDNEWFNITGEYIGEDTEITIRTIDLIAGIWYVYIYVIDSDEAVTSLIDDYNLAPQGIRIITDVLSNYLTWITFFIGLVIGILAGVGVVYKYFKSKYGESQTILPKKREIPPKKSLAKEKEKLTSVKEELETKELSEVKREEKEDTEGILKRKIKRKL
ncbi:MAG: hypothetical protein ACFE9I_17315 [Candidatus Hermodarchaeota archaeon]